MSTFEFDGTEYRNASNHQKEWDSKMLESLSFEGSEKVLDLGCGDGVLTQRISQLVPKGLVIGIDASKGMVDAATELCTDNLNFRFLAVLCGLIHRITNPKEWS